MDNYFEVTVAHTDEGTRKVLANFNLTSAPLARKLVRRIREKFAETEIGSSYELVSASSVPPSLVSELTYKVPTPVEHYLYRHVTQETWLNISATIHKFEQVEKDQVEEVATEVTKDIVTNLT